VALFPSASWDEFQAEVASILRIAPDAVRRDCELIDGLAADSVALAEIVAYVVVDCGVSDVAADLESIEWEGVTAGDLYRACQVGTAEGLTSRRPR
jgi:acyl carrier protein